MMAVSCLPSEEDKAFYWRAELNLESIRGFVVVTTAASWIRVLVLDDAAVVSFSLSAVKLLLCKKKEQYYYKCIVQCQLVFFTQNIP